MDEQESPLRYLTLKERSILKFYRLGHSVKALEPLLLCIKWREDNENQQHTPFAQWNFIIPPHLLFS